MFDSVSKRLRKGAPEEPAAGPTAPADPADPAGRKGRPTPSRKEAEAARRQSLRVPKDPKAAKRAMRERDREARLEARRGLNAGDSRYFPVRDRGPVRAYVRDFVDSRFTTAEYFLLLAIAVLVMGFIPSLAIQQILTIAWFSLTAIIVLDTTIVMLRLNTRLRRFFPDRKERKGATFYAILRILQFRRLRLPPPRLKRGQPIPDPS